MGQISRIFDKCTGHGGFHPRISASGSSNVFVNGRPALRIGDKWIVHCRKDHCHPSTQCGGSSAVRINGKGAARVGDKVCCGSSVMTGSGNVFAN